MHAELLPSSAQDRRIGLRLTPRSLSSRVPDALRALGYSLYESDGTDDSSFDDTRIWLVDADRLDEPGPEPKPDLRLLVIASPRQSSIDDPRVFAQTTRPGRLGPVYSMLQNALEETPRCTPRIPTKLSARCIRSDRRSIGAVLSLSEGGCLLRTREALRKGTKVDLQFALPSYGLISTPAECRYMRQGHAGLAFAAPPPDVRYTIAHFVTHQLASHEAVPPEQESREFCLA